MDVIWWQVLQFYAMPIVIGPYINANFNTEGENPPKNIQMPLLLEAQKVV
jgi:hypothetical protein